MVQKIKIVILTTLSFLLIWGCNTEKAEENVASHEIKMLYTDWTESMAMSYLSQILLERDLGYEVELRLTDVDAVFEALAAGDADVFVDAWLPATHESFIKKHKDNLEDIGPNYLHARTGLVVPDYMEIETISELNEMYDGEILGIDSTSGIMQNTERAIDLYGLKHNLVYASDDVMSEKFEDAWRRKNPIVITGWEPHWLFYRYELKYLHDPEQVYMAEETIHTMGKKGFAEEFPNAAEFFKRMVLTEKQMNALLYEMKFHKDPVEGVKVWIEKNTFTVNQWTKDLGVERKKIM